MKKLAGLTKILKKKQEKPSHHAPNKASYLDYANEVLSEVHYAKLFNNKPSQLDFLKANKKIIKHKNIPLVKPFDHTMFISVFDYIDSKVEKQILNRAIIENKKIIIESIFPTNIDLVKALYGENLISTSELHHKNKSVNFIRPVYYEYNDKLILAVTPGVDYLRHYASFIMSYVERHTSKPLSNIEVIRHSIYEQSITYWTNLDKKIISRGETVILGYVEEFSRIINKKYGITKKVDTEHYTSYKFSIGTKKFNLLGVKFSYWGSISSRIVGELCKLGAKNIFYVAKLGTLQSHDEVYSKLYSPTEYYLFNQDRIVFDVLDIRNLAVSMGVLQSSGVHVSVPTVLEETYIQRSVLDEIDAASIDNEISYMANVISYYNQIQGTKITFTPIHFATDYLRRSHEKIAVTEHDLSNQRHPESMKKKQSIKRQQFQVLLTILEKISSVR